MYSEIGLQQSKLWPAGTLCITIAANIAHTAILTFQACFPDSIGWTRPWRRPLDRLRSINGSRRPTRVYRSSSNSGCSEEHQCSEHPKCSADSCTSETSTNSASRSSSRKPCENTKTVQRASARDLEELFNSLVGRVAFEVSFDPLLAAALWRELICLNGRPTRYYDKWGRKGISLLGVNGPTTSRQRFCGTGPTSC